MISNYCITRTKHSSCLFDLISPEHDSCINLLRYIHPNMHHSGFNDYIALLLDLIKGVITLLPKNYIPSVGNRE